MPLQKQSLSLLLNAGIDTKTDKRLTDANAFLEQQNVRFDTVGAVKKANGYNQIMDGMALGFSKRLISDNQQLFSLSAPGINKSKAYLDSWAGMEANSSSALAPVNGCQINALEYFGGNSYSGGGWVDYYEGKYLVTCNQEFPSGRITSYPSLYSYDGSNYRSSVTNFTTSTTSDVVQYAKGAWIKSSGTKYAIFTAYGYIGGANKLLILVMDETLTTTVLETSIALGATSSDVALDVYPDRTKVVVAVRISATLIRIAEINHTGVLVSALVTPSSSISAIGDIHTTGTLHYVAGYKTSDRYPIVIAVNNSALTTAWTQIGTSVNMNFGTIASARNLALFESASGGVNVIMSGFDTAATYITCACYRVKQASITWIGVDYNAVNRGRGYDDGTNLFIPMASWQPTYSGGLGTFDLGGVSTQLFQTIGIAQMVQADLVTRYISTALFDRHIESQTIISNLTETETGKFVFCATEPLRTNGLLFSSQAQFDSRVTLLEIDLLNSNSQYGKACNLGDSLVTYDGLPSYLDGKTQEAVSFSYRPYVRTNGFTTGGSLAAGAYIVQCCFERSDSQGNIIRSSVSNQSLENTTGATGRISFDVPVGYWVGDATLCVYVTERNGSTFYLYGKISVPVGAKTVAGSITSVTGIAAGPQIYTSGGLLEDTACPPSTHAFIHNNRAWVVAADERDKLYYSKQFSQGSLPEFSQFLFAQSACSTPNLRDNIVAGGSVGDKIIIFRERSIYWMSGDGANAAGTNSTLTIPEVLSQDIGCVSAKSVILTPAGLFFKSAKGIYCINGGLELSYIGSPVEAYNDETIVESTLVPNKNLVIMATSDHLLIYDYFVQKWSVDTIANVISACTFEGELVVLQQDGTILKGNTGYLYDAEQIPMKVVTGWIKLSGLQDYHRIWRIMLLGEYLSEHNLNIKVYYDYDDSYFDNFDIVPDPALGAYQFSCHLIKQKCQAIKIVITEDGVGASALWTGLTFECGTKKGIANINTAKQY